MKTTRRISFHIVSIALLWLLGSVMTATGVAFAQEGQEDRDHSREQRDEGRDHFRGKWDFAKVVDMRIAAPGGTGTASAENGSRITLTGGGTFDLPSGRVTGGGTWQTQDPSGAITGSGEYRVRSFVSWTLSAGSLSCPPFGDILGNCEDARGGLLVLVVDYLDGTEGVLKFSCRLFGAPESMFEGVTMSKGFVDYWKHEKVNIDDSNCAIHVHFLK